MTGRARLGAAALGGATFVAGLSLSFGFASDGEAEADAPAPAGALAHVARMNAQANQIATERIRREGASAL